MDDEVKDEEKVRYDISLIEGILIYKEMELMKLMDEVISVEDEIKDYKERLLKLKSEVD